MQKYAEIWNSGKLVPPQPLFQNFPSIVSTNLVYVIINVNSKYVALRIVKGRKKSGDLTIETVISVDWAIYTPNSHSWK